MPARVIEKEHFSLQWLLERRFLPAIGGLALLGGILVRLYPHDEAFRDSIASFCDAIFIAAFLAYAVDPVVKHGLIKDTFGYVYGYSLPPDLQTFYDETIVKATILRRDHELHWTIKRLGATERTALQLDASFHVFNFTDKELDYTHKVYAISDTPGENGAVELLYCKNLKTNAVEYEYHQNQLKALKATVGPHTDARIGPKMRFAPKAVDAPPEYLFGVRYYSESALSFGVDEFRISELTSRLKVIVSVDEHLKDHLFTLIPPQDGQKDDIKPVLEDGGYRCTWEFHRLFVPNETVVLRWRAES